MGWGTRWGLILGLVALVASLVPQPAAAETRPAALTAATRWLRAQQHADGSFGAPRGDGGASTDAALAFAAVGVDLGTVRRGHQSLADYLLAIAPEYGRTPAGAAKLALVAVTRGQDPRRVAGRDLLATITAGRTAEGQYGASLFEHAYAVLALAGAGAPIEARAIERITSSQIADGAWGFAGPGRPGDGDTNTTALIVQALVAAGQTQSPALGRARDYLRQSLAPGGGFVYAPGQEMPPLADANSTALVAQALLALDEAPWAEGWGRSLDRLAAFQTASGALSWRDDQPNDNLLATVQGLPALAQRAFPLRPGEASGPRARRLAAQPAPVGADTAERRFFPETGHGLSHGFRHIWETRGGWAVFGLPLTEEFAEFNPADGRTYTVQYFERARFEYHPEQAGSGETVQFGLVGRQVALGRPEPAFAPIPAAPDPATCAYFVAVGHALCAPFRGAWEAQGGLDILGLPISEPFQEGGRLVQYFERARLERAGETIHLGLLGRELLYPAVGNE